jgi:hypothetical protein
MNSDELELVALIPQRAGMHMIGLMTAILRLPEQQRSAWTLMHLTDEPVDGFDNFMDGFMSQLESMFYIAWEEACEAEDEAGTSVFSNREYEQGNQL